VRSIPQYTATNVSESAANQRSALRRRAAGIGYAASNVNAQASASAESVKRRGSARIGSTRPICVHTASQNTLAPTIATIRSTLGDEL
jgi:hypothetical protein